MKISDKRLKILFSIFAAAGGILSFIGLACRAMLLHLTGTAGNSTAASIGIIGGSDGPTAVFISGSRSRLWGFLLVFSLAGAALLAAAIIIRKKR